jgi:hypothetical protein
MTQPLSGQSKPSWAEWNQAALVRELAEVHEGLTAFMSSSPPESGTQSSKSAALAAVPAAAPGESNLPGKSASALDTLCSIFGLSSFERKVLLLCAGVELDSRFAALFARAGKDQPPLPTFSLALAAFSDAHWSATLPARPLRLWRLVEMLSGDSLTTSPLRIDETVLHFLTGIESLDERLRGVVEPVTDPATLTPGEREIAECIAAAFRLASESGPPQVVHLSGSTSLDRRAIAARACSQVGLGLHRVQAAALPRGADLELFLRLWERQAALTSGALLVEFEDSSTLDPGVELAVKRLVDELRCPLLLSARDRALAIDRPALLLEVPRATAAEQVELWYRALGPAAATLNGEVESLVAQFSLNASAIYGAVAQVQVDSVDRSLVGSGGDRKLLSEALWQACRTQSRPRLEGLAQRIEPASTWDDLVLPEKEKEMLAQIALQLRQRARVYGAWGFAARSSRGLGISALFAGPSGTGKTMAGEVLANELNLDLYRIDLSQVISKYIGETEKNLRRVFDAAEDSAAILLFDEADALFGKRSEVKDSHDRYANIEVSYLLQRMEAYRGLAILTTNRREALDTAFLRRIRFVVEFSFPELAERTEIWRRAFPRQTPTEGLRIERLARLSAAGGNIRNIALGAAFLAADAGEPVRMAHLLAAARSEFTKMERPLADAEVSGWI